MDVNNMQDNVEYVKSNVVLNSYSSSEHFKGYCLSKIGWGNDEFTRSLLDVTTILIKNLQLVSSLNIGISLEEHVRQYSISQEDSHCLHSLIRDGVITNILGQEAHDNFHFDEGVDEKTALNLIYHQTSIGGAYGHSFFVDTANTVIVYPHDDCGIGFIITGSAECQNDKLRTLKAMGGKYESIMSLEVFKSEARKDGKLA